MQSIVPQIFPFFQKELWKQYLDTNGYVVIENILNKDEYNDILNTFKREWKEICPHFDFDDVETWNYENIEPLHGGFYYGMVNGHGFGQSDFQWKLRTNSQIVKIWETVHNTTELVSSMDGLSVFLSDTQEGIMYHTDQHPDDDLYSVQGAYNFFPVTLNDSGFIVVPRSHKTFKSDASEECKFICIQEDDPHLREAVHLQIPENCFVLWNSKTIHSSIGMNGKTNCFNRLTSYMCFFPKELRSQSMLQERIKGYLNGDNCSHYAIYHQVKPNPLNQRKLKPLLDEDGEIPENRKKYI